MITMALRGGMFFVLQIDFMYDSMKEAKAKMAAMRRELEVSRELQGKLTVQNCALQRAVNALARIWPRELEDKHSLSYLSTAGLNVQDSVYCFD